MDEIANLAEGGFERLPRQLFDSLQSGLLYAKLFRDGNLKCGALRRLLLGSDLLLNNANLSRDLIEVVSRYGGTCQILRGGK